MSHPSTEVPHPTQPLSRQRRRNMHAAMRREYQRQFGPPPQVLRRRRRGPVPYLTVSGEWLEDCGFRAGSCVRMVAYGDVITLTLVRPAEAHAPGNLRCMVDHVVVEQDLCCGCCSRK